MLSIVPSCRSVLPLERISLSRCHNVAWMLQSPASLIMYWDSSIMKLWPHPLPGLTVLPCLSMTCQVPQIGLHFESTRTSNIELQHNISLPSYGEELGSEPEELFATMERNLFTESDLVAGPDDLWLPIAQPFIGHEKFCLY
jgi:hypothetical protein